MNWSSAELEKIHTSQELVLVMHKDGHPERRVPVWPIVTGGNLFVRSWAGVGSVWFRRAVADTAQAIELGGRDIPVTFERVGDMDEIAIADGYSAKYGRSGQEYIGAMVAPEAVEGTMRITRR